jgi:hypothetical protein
MKKPFVVIDASFWINCVYLELNIFLIDYFNLIFTTKVKEKLLFSKKHDFFKKSKDITLFEEYLSLNKNVIKDPTKLSFTNQLSKNSGKLYSISLAKEKKYGVFIDDGFPYDVCGKNNILRMNSVDFIIFLYLKKEIDKNKAINLINSLNFRVKEKYLLKGIDKIKILKKAV